jgi:hypothetical protein
VFKKKEFIRRISDDCRIRHRHLKFKTKIIQFTVQAERSKKEGQKIVIVKVKGLAPIPTSRLINPELVSV